MDLITLELPAYFITKWNMNETLSSVKLIKMRRRLTAREKLASEMEIRQSLTSTRPTDASLNIPLKCD